MVKIEYDFRDVYDPATVITNTLTDGTIQTITADTTIENKRFTDIEDVILLINADNLNVTFKNCLFVNCDNIINSQSKPFGNITFEKCTFYNCKKIGNIYHDSTGNIIFKSCIISETPLLNTNRPITFTSGYKSIINELFGITSTVTYNDTVISNPMILIDSDYILMSKSRGYDYDSVSLNGVGYSGTYASPTEYLDAGVWNEKRAVKTTTNSVWNVEYIPSQVKGLKYFNKNDYEDYDGVSQSEFEKSIEFIELDFDSNGLTEDDVSHYLSMMKSHNNEVVIYPDSLDNTKYYRCKFERPDNTKYRKLTAIFWDSKRDQVKNDTLTGFSLTFNIIEKVGITNV